MTSSTANGTQKPSPVTHSVTRSADQMHADRIAAAIATSKANRMLVTMVVADPSEADAIVTAFCRRRGVVVRFHHNAERVLRFVTAGTKAWTVRVEVRR